SANRGTGWTWTARSRCSATTATGCRCCCWTGASTGTGGSRRTGCAGTWPGRPGPRPGRKAVVARTNLVWDWNGTLLDDLSLVVEATNRAFEAVGGRSVDSDEHRRTFRRPVAEFYAEVLERAVD